MSAHLPIPYQAIGAHGVIGDRRTAALVAADGTLDWLCLPDYDGAVFFGALLDAGKGGYWRLGPADFLLGKQAYRADTMALGTTGDVDGARLELTDVMPWPADDRPSPLRDLRAVIRCLRAVTGECRCCLQLAAAVNFERGTIAADSPTRARIRTGVHQLGLWTSRPLLAGGDQLNVEFTLHAGEECWAVLTWGDPDLDWSVERARTMLAETELFWKQWTAGLHGPDVRQVLHTGRLVHLLTYSPAGSIVAAPTTSLPERIGGDWNADYRLTWVRDASLSLATLSTLGNMTDARRYLEWLCNLGSSTNAPLQVIYGVRGDQDLHQDERKDLYGYRGSQPIRLGNHAYNQTQHDAMGYLLDGALHYSENGGEWHPEFSDLIRRVVNHLADAWEKPDNGIWELSACKNYVSGKVMSWVAMDRAIKLAKHLGHTEDIERWRATGERIRHAVLERGWSEKLGAFRQHFDADNLDAATLLIPIMGLLPPDDPRVVATVERIAQRLTCDGFVFRFDPLQTPGVPQPPLLMGEYEGAFWPCTFWLATVYAMLGRHQQAEAILDRADAHARGNALFAEAIDPRTGEMRGNSPLLFSHSEYVRAVLALQHANGQR